MMEVDKMTQIRERHKLEEIVRQHLQVDMFVGQARSRVHAFCSVEISEQRIIVGASSRFA